MAVGLRPKYEPNAAAALFRLVIATMATGAALVGLGGGTHAQDFNGYPCTEDCSGHQAGYDWAQDNGIADPYECSGNSQSFIEGCQSYAEENADPDEQYGSDEEIDMDDPGTDDDLE